MPTRRQKLDKRLADQVENRRKNGQRKKKERARKAAWEKKLAEEEGKSKE